MKEIERLLMRIDTLEGANERFMQAKERQDNEMAMVQQRNRELLSQVRRIFLQIMVIFFNLWII